MVRVLLLIAILAGIASGVLGFLNNTKKKDAIAATQQAQAEAATAKSQLSKTSDELKATKSDLADAQQKIADATQQAQAAQSQLAAAQAKASDLETKAAAAEQKANAATAALDDVKAQAGAASDAAKKAQADADRLDKEKRGVQDELAQANAEVARLNDVIKRSQNGAQPPGISGKIVSVNRNWNFVVLNIGEKDGLVEKGELIVSRNKQVIGRIRVVSTEANTAVADILVNTLQGQIEPGDDVLN